ncbi:hypothetical protein K402DRAFT_397970 [Aulographum hederae CBS 113979]|uniref:HIT-type domain-containing protein n=1 Tax=Aulographum hederae CBS 113979 TaxID=1176131 RepID=A0A6G1GM89_9PEZI|nr:hypothetical protein K402DRAFT_397970 [Aulographum hederae CBS 113979]
MPSIEEVPLATLAKAGWAYVPDTGFDPSKQPINPVRKQRAARNVPAAARLVHSARQERAIQSRLAELDKDNTKDIQIPASIKSSRVTKPKTSTNVKKILQSQKTFANHLSDEEAMIALQISQPAVPSRSQPAKVGGGAQKTSGLSRPGVASSSRRTSTPTTPSNLSMGPPPLVVLDSSTTDTGAMAEAEAEAKAKAKAAFPQDAKKPPLHPLLLIDALTAPTEEEMEALLSAPPLSYSAARAVPPNSAGPPQRFFCEFCGYWGRIKCRQCGARICGLVCKGEHDQNCARYT